MRAALGAAWLGLALLSSSARAQQATTAAPTAEEAPTPEIDAAPAPAPAPETEPPMPPVEPATPPEVAPAAVDAPPEVAPAATDDPAETTAAPPLAAAPLGAEQTLPSPWSLGAGLRLGTLGGELGSPMAIGGAAGSVSSLGGIGYLYPGLSAPAPSLFAEYQLFSQLALLGQAQLGFSYMRSENSATSFALPEARYDYGVDLAGGARYCLNPGGLVELSLFGVLYAGYVGQRAVYIAQNTTVAGAAEETKTVVYLNAIDAGLRAGLVLERELIEGVTLRLQTSLVRIGGSFGIYDAELTGPDGSTVATDPDDRPWQVGVDAGVELSPTLELRFRF